MKIVYKDKVSDRLLGIITESMVNDTPIEKAILTEDEFKRLKEELNLATPAQRMVVFGIPIEVETP